MLLAGGRVFSAAGFFVTEEAAQKEPPLHTQNSTCINHYLTITFCVR